MGGWSPEREVSLVSGKACAEGLREGGHEVVEYDVKRDLRALVDFLRPAGGGGPDVVFNALHGKIRRGWLHPGRARDPEGALHAFRRARLGDRHGQADVAARLHLDRHPRR